MQQIIDEIRDAYAAFNRGDIRDCLKIMDDDIEWIEPEEFLDGGVYHGKEGAYKYLSHSRESWAEIYSEPEDIIQAGDKIVVYVYARVRPRGSNEFTEAAIADVYTIRNNKAVQMHAFANREEAFKFAGLL